MTILDKIIAEKQKEVARMYETRQVNQETDIGQLHKGGTFFDYVRANNRMSIIAEIKRASPSKGIINADVNPIEQAKAYADNGVQAISVLTDEPFFKGSMDDLRAVREVVDVPVLCKDFIIDPIQIDRAQRAGATIILLIAAALDDQELQSLYTYAKELQLDVLCEVHNEAEMERVLRLDADII